jgi:ABC-type phosphate transport system substrate-binding protein
MKQSAWRARWAALTVMAAGLVAGPFLWPQAAGAATGLIGAGSSFAALEVQNWTSAVAKPPYNLNIQYSSTSSGDGRFSFAKQSIDFAVTDIPYQGYPFDTASPSFPFIYVPVTAGGLAFMYHINGLSTKLQLSSYSACALMTGGVAYWDDQIIKADNPGVSLPHTPVHPVTRTDLAGTNFVLQEYCIHEQPALWAAFVGSKAVQQYQGQVNDLSATAPRSDWPLFPGAIPVSGSATAADTVSNPNDDGYVTAVETAYATQRGFPVASVKNASGDYTQPTAVGVASALAYATQQSNGTHVLDFDGQGPLVYNPSTYSYLVTATTGWDPSKGAVLSQFANYSLTLGQQTAPQNGYASLGLSLEQYGVNAIKANVPGAVALTSAEQNAYACGDFTPAEVQKGATSPTCGVTNPNNSSTPGVAGSGSSNGAISGSSESSGGASRGSSGTSGTSGGSGGVDPAVALSGSAPALSYTGVNPLPLLVVGVSLFGLGWLGRRRLIRAERRLMRVGR